MGQPLNRFLNGLLPVASDSREMPWRGRHRYHDGRVKCRMLGSKSIVQRQ